MNSIKGDTIEFIIRQDGRSSYRASCDINNNKRLAEIYRVLVSKFGISFTDGGKGWFD